MVKATTQGPSTAQGTHPVRRSKRFNRRKHFSAMDDELINQFLSYFPYRFQYLYQYLEDDN
ncbi:MAG: hypothetical protein K2X29_00985 [Candidatus Obscuribacterales bacterium]|nr:hypothetical protein [Candidatus Obscuribacterales bacterium]